MILVLERIVSQTILLSGWCSFKDFNIPIHNGQEPEGPKTAVSRAFAGTSRDILLRAESLDLRPLSDMECDRIEAAIDQSYGNDIKCIRFVPEGFLIDPCRELEGGAYWPSVNVFAGHTEDEGNQCRASDHGREDSDTGRKAEFGDEEFERQGIDDAACSGSG